MQAAAYKLISAEEAPFVHFKIASWLQRSTFSEAFVYDAVDNMILARDLGYPLNSQDQLDDLAGFGTSDSYLIANESKEDVLLTGLFLFQPVKPLSVRHPPPPLHRLSHTSRKARRSCSLAQPYLKTELTSLSLLFSRLNR
jgi:hypothetical protein